VRTFGLNKTFGQTSVVKPGWGLVQLRSPLGLLLIYHRVTVLSERVAHAEHEPFQNSPQPVVHRFHTTSLHPAASNQMDSGSCFSQETALHHSILRWLDALLDPTTYSLRFAYLCQDCDSVGNDAHCCPACASSALMNLACVLDRKAVRSEKLDLHYSFRSRHYSYLEGRLTGGSSAWQR